MKTKRFELRLTEEQKKNWQAIADENRMSLTDYIIHKVEGNLGKSERREILKFIEISTNTDSKVENNINQIAKWVNTHQQITVGKMDEYLLELEKYQRLIKERNVALKKIILFLSKI
ncbi:hypothetical protein ACPDHJ_12630 [Myroides sp. C8-3]|uniref:hypothetical protein n=1 Tax=Myroides sp. C8-3 TaxID=3400533 RepID=UPI003D2F51EA